MLQLPRKFRIAPSVEYRSGFPYAVTDAAQNYLGVPDQSRFPNFFSIDARASKDFKINPKYTVRLSVSAFNLTDHFNPEAFHNNPADPAYGTFFGQRGRHFTADFDVVFDALPIGEKRPASAGATRVRCRVDTWLSSGRR